MIGVRNAADTPLFASDDITTESRSLPSNPSPVFTVFAPTFNAPPSRFVSKSAAAKANSPGSDSITSFAISFSAAALSAPALSARSLSTFAECRFHDSSRLAAHAMPFTDSPADTTSAASSALPLQLASALSSFICASVTFGAASAANASCAAILRLALEAISLCLTSLPRSSPIFASFARPALPLNERTALAGTVRSLPSPHIERYISPAFVTMSPWVRMSAAPTASH